MAVCHVCGREMLGADSCNADPVLTTEGLRPPVPAFSVQGGERCHDCGIRAGGYHHPFCDMAQCPICGGQLISCGHLAYDPLEDPGLDPRTDPGGPWGWGGPNRTR